MSLKKDTRNKSLARLPLVAAVVAGLYGPAVLAQDPPSEPENEEQAAENAADATELETITVTGSLINRLGFNSMSPVQIITADVSATTGQLDTASILQTTSVASGTTQISNQFSGFVVEGGNGNQSIALRGLGASRTLVLLDGKRPGPAGTRGQVGAFDLNVIPSVILQRVELLKDGGGSIYGSDGIGGVVNLITRKSVDQPTLIFETDLPQEAGGSSYSVSGATGWNFDNGSIVAAFQFYDQQPLSVGDRDFLACPQDLVRDASGNIVDREDRSVIGDTALGGCNNLYYNTVISGANRYIPSPDGVTIGPIPGYRPRANANASGGNPAYYEDVLNADFFGESHIFSSQERSSLFVGADFSFDRVDWSGQLLYTNRETESRRFRQFFPTMDYRSVGLSANSLPVMPFKSDANIDVDFLYAASSFKGGFGSDSTWSWNFDTTFSRSDGDYEVFSIDANKTGDRFRDLDGGGAPVNYLDPVFLSGRGMERLAQEIGVWHTGNTVYDQFVVNATATGELFELPAGVVAAAIGTEFRRISIDDNPSELERTGRLWGQSSATGTEGKDYIQEIFGEIEVPLLSGIPGIEELAVNASGRVFKYDTVADSDSIWKLGMRWQIIPSLSVRATRGTSYRAPGLYELFLGDQTSFVGQFAIDPCIDWGNSTNPNVRANCAAEGIPDDYNGAGSSATVITGGGLGVLKPETSTATTAGIVFTPSWANFTASVDYFEIDVRDQISQLGAGAIVGSCYALPNYPNAFCDLFNRRGTGSDPLNIDVIRDSYLNINKQLVRGYDLNLRWDGDFNFGKVEVESQFTYTMENVEQLFDSSLESGFDSNDYVGLISYPKLVGNVRSSLTRGDFTYTWGMRYVDETENFNFTQPAAYFGNPNPVYDTVAEDRLYHTLSVIYRADSWDLLVGVDNVFDKDPPNVSTGTATRYGNIPAFATQYDWFGRSLYARMTYRF
ncbi:TonB-dependent receptor plug domain-containing protein [Arenimonas metalli]|uniref:TonB-dependent receptor plug domain-containing protein n=1 Tax=Arenimonas metalli TaxID=948077 RepID=UPI0005564D84|nr:TonB-dependent receptor [Arenimonas metalli]